MAPKNKEAINHLEFILGQQCKLLLFSGTNAYKRDKDYIEISCNGCLSSEYEHGIRHEKQSPFMFFHFHHEIARSSSLPYL